MKSIWHYKYPVGEIGIAEEDGAISHVFFGNEKHLSGFNKAETSLIKKAALQLSEYFENKRKHFDLPLSLRGTDFQRSVWKALQTIPWGETRSYKDIAQLIKNPKACRAVGMANNKNPVAIIVPCHRVIGQDGSLVGYAEGLEKKQYLLELENNNV